MRFVCAGYRYEGKSLLVAFYEAAPETHTPVGDIRLFPVKPKSMMKKLGAWPGNVFPVEPKGDTSYIFPQANPVDVYQGPEVLNWTIKHEQAVREKALQKSLANALMDAPLSTIKREYHRLPYPHRQQLLARIVAYLTS